MLELLSPRGFRVDLVLRYFDCTPKKRKGKKQRRAVSVRHTFVAETVIDAHAHTRCCFALCKAPSFLFRTQVVYELAYAMDGMYDALFW